MRLPTPEAHGLPDDATIAVPATAAGLTFFRLLRSGSPRLEDLEPDWTRPQAQRRRIPELFRVSASRWLEQSRALRASTRRADFIARLEPADGPLIRVALMEHEGLGRVEAAARSSHLSSAGRGPDGHPRAAARSGKPVPLLTSTAVIRRAIPTTPEVAVQEPGSYVAVTALARVHTLRARVALTRAAVGLGYARRVAPPLAAFAAIATGAA